MDDLELIIGGFINLFIKNSKDLFSNRIDPLTDDYETAGHFYREMCM